MIERDHLAALQKVRSLTDRAIDEGRLTDARVSTDQAAAILELEVARREIFERRGVDDIPLEADIPRTDLEPIVLNDLWGRGDLLTRAYNSLRRNDIEYLQEVAVLDDQQLLSFRNFGPQSLSNVRAVQEQYLGKSYKPAPPKQG